MKHLSVLFFFICFCTYSQIQNKTTIVKYIDKEITIDGILDEPSWSEVIPATNFFQYFPTDTAQAKRQAQIKFMFDEKKFVCGD